MTLIKISNFQLHEQMIEFRLNFEHRTIHYDSNIEFLETFKNRSSFQVLYIKFLIFERENESLKQKIIRFRVRRNDYRQKSHQLKKKMNKFRLQLIKYQEENIFDSDAKKQQFKKFDLLHVDFHFFKRSISIFFFVSFIFFNIERFVISTTSIHDYYIKYFDIDDFHDDKKKWKQ